jgi:hypothetical protein
MMGLLGWLLWARVLRHRFSLQSKSSAKPKPINEHQGSRTSLRQGRFARTGLGNRFTRVNRVTDFSSYPGYPNPDQVSEIQEPGTPIPVPSFGQ